MCVSVLCLFVSLLCVHNSLTLVINLQQEHTRMHYAFNMWKSALVQMAFLLLTRIAHWWAKVCSQKCVAKNCNSASFSSSMTSWCVMCRVCVCVLCDVSCAVCTMCYVCVRCAMCVCDVLCCAVLWMCKHDVCQGFNSVSS